jgi:PAS domain S-box-containing protein
MHVATIQSGNAAEVPRLARRLRQASQVIAFLVALLGLVVFCAWVFHVPGLTYIRPTFQSMKVNTTLSFLCLGAALWLAQDDKRQRSRRILAYLVIIIAGATLAEYAFHVSLGIDQLLFRDTRHPSLSAYPGRMAIATAASFLLLGLAVALIGLKKSIALRQAMVAACFMFSLVALCGYLYGVKPLYSITASSTMGLHTAAGLMAACLASFLARPDEGILSIAASNTNCGFLLRRLLPAIIFVPIVVGWLTLAGQRADHYDMPFGIVLQVLGSVVCLTLLTLLIMRSMHRLEDEHSRAEELAMKSALRLQRLLETDAVDILFFEAATGVLVDASDVFLRMSGYTREQVQRRELTWQTLTSPEWIEASEEQMKKFTATGRIGPYEKEYLCADGSRRWMLFAGRDLGDGTAAEYCIDITDRKLAEAALRTSEQRLRLAQQAGRIGTFEWNIQSGVNLWTPGLEAMYGLGEGEFAKTQLAWEQLVHPDDRAAAVALANRALETGEPVEGEWRVLWRDGSVHWIFGCCQLVKTAAGEPLSLTGVNIDITERKRAEAELRKYRLHLEELVRERTLQLEAANALLQTDVAERRRTEEALRASESRFRSLFESSPIAVLETSPDGRAYAANPAACAMLGMSEAEICRAGREGLIDSTDPRIATFLEQRQRTGRVMAAELNIIRGNGERFPAEVDSVILPGNPPRSFVMLRDITERKRTEAALLRSEKLASLGRMAAAIAHEINNPLAAVMNLLFLASRTSRLPESTRRLLKAADAELRRIAHITRQSLGFYRETNAPGPTSVTAVLDSVLDLLKNRIKAKHAVVKKQWKGDVQITAVPGELRQVFSNLVANSLDAIDERGTIWVRVASGKQYVRVTVSDNGKGISSSAVSHIFEPFFTTKDKVGTGLGLWVSQQIVEKHGGKIRARSRSEGSRRGTTLSVVLPVGPGAAERLSAVA